MEITLKKITKANFEQVGELHLPDEQQQHLSENIWSIAESLFHETHEARAIYAQSELVGFVMWVQISDTRISIWRFMVAYEFQNKGIGRKSLLKAVEEIKSRKGIEAIDICYSPDNHIAKRLYFSLGFSEYELSDDGEEAYASINLTGG